VAALGGREGERRAGFGSREWTDRWEATEEAHLRRTREGKRGERGEGRGERGEGRGEIEYVCNT
jgi:hypothetical protein